MMDNLIKITISKGIASLVNSEDYLIGKNHKKYKIEFLFDLEWKDFTVKTAKFVVNGKSFYSVFDGNVCDVPAFPGGAICKIGVVSGNALTDEEAPQMFTTTPAEISVLTSIDDIAGKPADPDPNVYDQIMAILNKIMEGGVGSGGTTPQLRINTTTNYWEVSYDNGITWISLGVKATGKDGVDGLTPHIGTNGNWWIGEEDTGVKAEGGTTAEEVEKEVDITLKITDPDTVSATITLAEPLSKDIYIRLYKSYRQTTGQYSESAPEVFIPEGTTVYDYCDYPEGGASDVYLFFDSQQLDDSVIVVDNFHIQYKTGEMITQIEADALRVGNIYVTNYIKLPPQDVSIIDEGSHCAVTGEVVYKYVNAVIEDLAGAIGDIDSALDAIIELQNYYTGATFDELHEYAQGVASGGES